MVKVTVKHVVENPRHRVWRLFSDLSLIVEYHPHVKGAQVLSPEKRPAGIGATRHCHFFDGTSTKEEVVQLLAKDYMVWKVQQICPSEPDASVTMGEDDESCSLYSSPVKEMTVKYIAIALSPTRTRIQIDAIFDMPADEDFPSQAFGCYDIRFLRRLQMKRNIANRLHAVLEGMDYYLTTGERVDKDVLR
jgi:hypothetical protein